MKYFCLAIILLSHPTLKADENLDFWKDGLKGVALYHTDTPLAGNAMLKWSVSNRKHWNAPKHFDARTTTKSQLVLFYDAKNITTAEDRLANTVVIIKELVCTVDNELVDIISKSNIEKRGVSRIPIRDLIRKLGLNNEDKRFER